MYNCAASSENRENREHRAFFSTAFACRQRFAQIETCGALTLGQARKCLDKPSFFTATIQKPPFPPRFQKDGTKMLVYPFLLENNSSGHIFVKYYTSINPFHNKLAFKPEQMYANEQCLQNLHLWKVECIILHFEALFP